VTRLEVGALASHFALLGIDGHEYAVPGGVGEVPLLLVFFRSTCPTCDIAFPYINRLHESYPGQLAVWAVSQDDPEKARSYARKLRLSYPVLLDAPALDVSRLYDPPSTPTAYLVAPNGRIEFVAEGFAKADMNDISRLVADRLGVRTVEVAPADDGRPAMKPGCMARQRMPNRR
jgi:peroxiredoxin